MRSNSFAVKNPAAVNPAARPATGTQDSRSAIRKLLNNKAKRTENM